MVTAQRRAERLVDVPISVNSLSQQELETKQINSVADLGKSVTSLRFEGNMPAFQPTLRGVGTLVQGAGTDSNVAVYIDGFYVSNNYGMSFDLPNVSNIQVLKGPQGTLFGRNATAGAILITTADPASELTGRVKATYADYNDIKLQGYLSGPITENLSAGMSVYYRKGDGFLHDIDTGSDKVGRVKMFNIRPDLMYSNNDNLKIRLIYEHGYAFDASGMGGVVQDGYAVAALLGANYADSPNEYGGEFKPKIDSKTDAGYAQIELGLTDDVTLKSSTSYRHDRTNFETDYDFSSLAIFGATSPTDNKTFSQEFLLSGKTGRLDWLVGANYYRNKSWEYTTVILGIDPFDPSAGYNYLNYKDITVTTKAWAGFADLTYELADGLFVTAGGRYSTEKKDAVAPLPVGSDSARWNKFTPRAVVRYKFAPDSNIYASYSKGFRSGAFAGFPPNKVNPESIDAYEVGFKHRSGILELTSAAFLYNFKDVQVTIISIEEPGVTKNAARQRNYGAEMELAIHPTNAWRIGLSGAYLNAKYRKFPDAVENYKDGPGSWGQRGVDASGTWVPRSPKWTGNISSTYDIGLKGGTLQLAGNLSMTSHFYHGLNEQLREPGYTKLDLSTTFSPESQGWQVTFFVNNVTNHRNALQRGASLTGTSARFDWPRVIGASIGYNF
ncbi:MAG: TonB-dependent receptor [Sphingobium sp.]